MKYQCQVRTILRSGSWSEWENVGDPMTEQERLNFLNIQRELPHIPAQFRFIKVSVTFPSVFKSQ